MCWYWCHLFFHIFSKEKSPKKKETLTYHLCPVVGLNRMRGHPEMVSGSLSWFVWMWWPKLCSDLQISDDPPIKSMLQPNTLLNMRFFENAPWFASCMIWIPTIALKKPQRGIKYLWVKNKTKTRRKGKDSPHAAHHDRVPRREKSNHCDKQLNILQPVVLTGQIATLKVRIHKSLHFHVKWRVKRELFLILGHSWLVNYSNLVLGQDVTHCCIWMHRLEQCSRVLGT